MIIGRNAFGVLYPAHDESSNSVLIKFPVKYCLNQELRNILIINFSEIPTVLKLNQFTKLGLQKAFGLIDITISKDSQKKEILSMIRSGEYKTKAAIAQEIGLSDSYVSRILKYRE